METNKERIEEINFSPYNLVRYKYQTEYNSYKDKLEEIKQFIDGTLKGIQPYY